MCIKSANDSDRCCHWRILKTQTQPRIMTRKQKGIAALILACALVLLDQIVKIYVKTHFFLGEHVDVFSWFQIRFIENNGMAFGIELFDKVALTLFRIVAVAFLSYYLYRVVRKNFKLSYVLCVAALVAGALGNIIDCVFYGVVFDASQFPHLATLFPEGGGYAPFFYGKVVDMLYFPLIDTTLPQWIPFVGGSHFTFFDPVFNIADSAICVSIFYALLFERDILKTEFQDEEKKATR